LQGNLRSREGLSPFFNGLLGFGAGAGALYEPNREGVSATRRRTWAAAGHRQSCPSG